MLNHTQYALCLLMLSLCLGCETAPRDEGSEEQKAWAAKADGLDWLEGDPVRIAMAQVRSDLPDKDYWSLMHEGAVEAREFSGEEALSGFSKKGILFSLGGANREVDSEHIRVWRYRLGADVPPMLVRHESSETNIPFKMKAGASVEFARSFESRHEATFANAPTLMDLPHDSESALKLERGTVVSLPLEGRLSVDVNGRFLRRTASTSPELVPFVGTSATGSTSGLRQGTLLTEGDLLFQVIRLDDSRVRLRVATGVVLDGDVDLGLDARGLAFYRFVPCATIDKARAIKTRVEKAERRIDALGSVEDRIERLRGRIDNKLNQLIMLPLPVDNQLFESLGEGVDWSFDRALEIAKSARALEDIERAVLTRTEKLLNKGLSDWNAYVEPSLQVIRRWSSRTYNLNASVALNANTARRIRTLADYEFDLSDEAARRAFDRAITGRALWLDMKSWFGGGSLESVRLSDLTLADNIASTDGSADYPRVIRHARAFGDLRTQHYGVEISGPWMSLDMDWNHSEKRIALIDAEGARTEWEARAWQYERKTSFFGNKDTTSFASGAFIELGQEDLLGGGYWFTWSKQHSSSAYHPVAKSLGEFMNLLGPLAVSAGIPALYDGEHEGRVSAQLDVMFSGEAMDYLFDPQLTDDALLWRVFGEVADTFANSFELPIIMNPFRPEGLEDIEGAVEACEKVAYHFGGWYCVYFHDTFLPALRFAQASEDPEARLSFLEHFYQKGVFGKPVGSRLLVRYLASLMASIGLSDEISIRAEVRNGSDDSFSASPVLERGSPEALALIETMTPAGLR